MKEGISVVIPCYNSANRLESTLQHLANQKVPDNILWEIVIVDNASTDNTRERALSIWHALNVDLPFKIVTEHVQGLSAARRRGFEESQFEYVVFCDDDNWLNENYIRICFEVMTNDPSIGILGGLGVPITDGSLPAWFDSRITGYGQGKQNDKSGDITNQKGYVYGAGFVIRRSAWELIHQYDFPQFLSDRKGNKLTSGGDVELCYAIRIAGYKIWYDERLHFKHFLPKHRLSWKYYLKLKQMAHGANPVMHAYNYILSLNEQQYVRPSRFYWVYMSLQLFGSIKKKYWKVIILSFFYRLEGNGALKAYYSSKGQLIGWLRIRSRYADICDLINSFKNKTVNNSL